MADQEGTRRSTLVRCKQHGRIYDSAKTQCPACLAESKGTSPPPPQATPKRGAPPAPMTDDSKGAWWKTMGSGLFFVAVSVFLFYYFTDLEESGGTRRIIWIVAILYKVGGKWVTCGVFGLLGLLQIGMGIKEFKDR